MTHCYVLVDRDIVLLEGLNVRHDVVEWRLTVVDVAHGA